VISELKGGVKKSGKGEYMQQCKVIDLTQYRTVEKTKKIKKVKKGKGSVYTRSGKLWVDFRYLGERVREPSGLSDFTGNKSLVRKQLNLITAEIDNGIFEFAKRFPHSSKKDYFTELEGKTVKKDPKDVLFGQYVQMWLEAMQPGMSSSQIRDYASALNCHLLPFFEKIPFNEFTPVLLKKFVAHMKSMKNRYGKPLSAKRIQNIMIPLRVIVKDAFDEYGWLDLVDPFSRLKLPRPIKFRVQPFSFEEWKIIINHIPDWYKPYFEFAVQTGLRPSEQVALKWDAIDDEYIHIELSRVRNEEKTALKTYESRRRIQLRPTLKKILDWQKELTKDFQSPYVFLNTQGRPILQDKMREIWSRRMKKSGLAYRRMYETRHTFASWALALGETPEWVARTLGHVDTSMVYSTYGRYIPNLTKLDGSALESRFAEPANKKGNPDRHNFGHNCEFQSCQTS